VEFRALPVTVVPAFLIRNVVDDTALFSGLYEFETLDQAVAEMVAGAADEAAVVEWLAARVDAASALALNAKLETFVVERMSPDDHVLIRQRHPLKQTRPELSKILDILEADDKVASS
jgi:hypothetical protein